MPFLSSVGHAWLAFLFLSRKSFPTLPNNEIYYCRNKQIRPVTLSCGFIQKSLIYLYNIYWKCLYERRLLAFVSILAFVPIYFCIAEQTFSMEVYGEAQVVGEVTTLHRGNGAKRKHNTQSNITCSSSRWLYSFKV